MSSAARPTEARLRALARRFRISGDIGRIEPYGSGHINDTYCAAASQAGAPVRYILQRINTAIFKDPAALMDNVGRVTTHLAARLARQGAADASRRALTLVPTVEGAPWLRDEEGGAWRVYLFIEGARTFDQIETPAQAEAAARAFGEFQRQLADLPAPRLADTIPNFHHTRARFDTLRAAIEADAHNRAASVRSEIDFALAREPIVDVLLRAQTSGAIPERVTHNDTKLNNIMLDDATGEGICVIDLDTVMPGLVLYDFGDMCRTATRPTLEDERDLSKVAMMPEMFGALARGYLASAGGFLVPAEIDRLVFSARLIAFEIGIRFLADYLQGDVYFKTHRPGQNADRCRVQFTMVESFERHEESMNRWIADLRARGPEAPA